VLDHVRRCRNQSERAFTDGLARLSRSITVRVPQFWTAPPVEFRRVPLDPKPDREVIDAEVPLSHNCCQFREAQRILQVAADAEDNDMPAKCRPLNTTGRFRPI
jgi:hypothetical protein